MLNKHIFIVRGVSNSGKTHTIRSIAERLVVRYMGKHKNTKNVVPLKITVDVLWGTVSAKELLCIITIECDGKKIVIGICTAGDTVEIIQKKMQELIDTNCDAIVCGCKGVEDDCYDIYNEIVNIANNYNAHSETTKHTKDEPDDPIDENVAESILDALCNVIDNEFGFLNGRNTFIHS